MMPPNSMNNGNMPFMGRPPFGPNAPNFNNGNGNMPFMPPNMMPPNSMPNNMPPSNMPPSNMPPSSISLHNIPEPKPLDSMPEMNLQNIPPPLPQLSHIPSPKDEPTSPANQVSSADWPPSVLRAATEVARNGDHWENVLKAIHSQDQNMWFLHNTNSNEYKEFRELVEKFRRESPEKKPEVKPEDVYEPEFCLDDDYDSDDDYKAADKKFSFGGQDSQKPWNQFNLGNSVKREAASSQSDDESESKRERRKKKSRWGDEPPVADIKPPGVVAPLPPGMAPFQPGMPPMPPGMPPMPPGMPPMPPLPGLKLAKVEEDGLKLTNVNRSNPALMQYAMTNYGTINLSAEDWKKCEDNFKLNLLFQDMLKKRQEVERLASSGKHKYEYDSDEDTAEGTWEHKLRAKEMYATEKWADELTKQAAGKHHIGDFLPPEELKKFMEKYSAVKTGKEPDLSDYKEFKLKEDNVGFKMLQKLGWSEGQGLGAEGTGIVDPINKANQPVANMGLGASSSDVVSPDDDEFDAYRKRMMLAYRFRPNPLNNPRRPYY